MEGMTLGVPPVEVSNDGYLYRVGGLDSKVGPLCATSGHEVRPELFVESVVGALLEVMQVVIS